MFAAIIPGNSVKTSRISIFVEIPGAVSDVASPEWPPLSSASCPGLHQLDTMKEEKHNLEKWKLIRLVARTRIKIDENEKKKKLIGVWGTVSTRADTPHRAPYLTKNDGTVYATETEREGSVMMIEKWTGERRYAGRSSARDRATATHTHTHIRALRASVNRCRTRTFSMTRRCQISEFASWTGDGWNYRVEYYKFRACDWFTNCSTIFSQ